METRIREVMYDLRQNSVLAEEFHAVGAVRFGMLRTDQEGAIGGSTGTFFNGLSTTISQCFANRLYFSQISATSPMVRPVDLSRKERV